ncbi:MAG: aldo/keto reductase [Chloroflexi bacterium]|nr:aldo/keto reductase [Chloroflexota bacterium]
MEYRSLGRTGWQVSVIGMGCAMLGNFGMEHGIRLVRRELEWGVNYFDTARIYGDSEIKLGIALQDVRERVFVSTKTNEPSEEGAWRQINESLERLRFDYVNNIHFHSLESEEDIARRLGPGGALKALVRAREEGLTQFIGCTSHRADILLKALQRFPFDLILVPMNLVERQPLEALIPYCRTHGVGITIMKPVATGLLPARLALKWLRTQPIDVAVPGVSTLAEVDEDLSTGEGEASLTPEEEEEVVRWQEKLAHVRCRICGECLPCPVGIPIHMHLGTDMMYDHYRSMGAEGFRAHSWGRAGMEADLAYRKARIAAIEACTRCGACEARCPYGLPIIEMLQAMLPGMREIVAFFEAELKKRAV